MRERERETERVHARERARTSKRGTEKKEERESGAGTTTTAMGASSQQRQQWGLRGRGLDRRRDTAGPASIDAVDVPRLWSAEGRRGRAPTIAGTVRRSTGQAVGEGRWDAGVHDKIFHRLCQRTDVFQGDGSIFFFRVLEPSATTTLPSWGRLPVRTPTTVASHDSRTPVSGGRVIGIWCRWSWEGTFATPILVILGVTSSADDHHRAVSTAS